jgi:beta-xylosidase
MKMPKQTTIARLAGIALLALSLTAVHAAEPARFPVEKHVQDPHIARAEDGTYYLTGTTDINTFDPKYADFQNNDGVRLWKSKDLKTWEDAGLVFDLSKARGQFAQYTKGRWIEHLRAVPSQPDKPWSRGVTAPEIHRVKDNWWIVFALNDQDIGLLKSKTGAPEGPYEEVGRLTNLFLGGDGSLFEDSDGKVYFVWGEGYIAPMKDDMSDIADKPKSLQMAIAGFPQKSPLPDQTGARGATIYKEGGTYRFVYSAWNRRDGKGRFDTVVCESKSLLGPYSKPKMLVPDAGPVSVFRDGTDGFRAVYLKDDTLKFSSLVNGEAR